MADPEGSDKFLLERLNALKPTSITLDPASKPDLSATIEKAQPPSKEDALSHRLKSLRNQIGDAGPRPPSSPGSSGLPPPLPHSDAGATISPSAAQPHTSGDNAGEEEDRGASSRNPAAAAAGAVGEGGGGGDVDVDPLLATDDETLEDLLAELGSDQTWLDGIAAEEEERHRQAIALLEELSAKKGGEEDAPPGSRHSHREESGDDSNSDDDSERGQMARDADAVLARALDEVELERSRRQPTASASASASSPPESATPPTGDDDTSSRRKDGGFQLPAVPSQLQDQPDDFETNIAARMAALQVSSPPSMSLPSVPAADVNALGLPGAPTFAPHERLVPGLLKTKFTDEDQRSWCTVCLEDGAIRCLGCDDDDSGGDIYCARCWKEMHVGPRAEYEERGHRWEKYVRGR